MDPRGPTGSTNFQTVMRTDLSLDPERVEVTNHVNERPTPDWQRIVQPVLGLALIQLVIVFAYISPLYEVPQNDDWAYFETLRLWFETGRLQHIGWNDPTLVAQVWWGALFARFFGLSYSSLRCSALVLSCLGVISFYGNPA